MKCYIAEFCSDDGKAFALAAQVSDHNHTGWVWVPVCRAHHDGWWDGSDVPRRERPPSVLITATIDAE